MGLVLGLFGIEGGADCEGDGGECDGCGLII